MDDQRPMVDGSARLCRQFEVISESRLRNGYDQAFLKAVMCAQPMRIFSGSVSFDLHQNCKDARHHSGTLCCRKMADRGRETGHDAERAAAETHDKLCVQ